MTEVIPVTDTKPAVTIAKFGLEKFGLSRFGAIKPSNPNTPHLMKWRKKDSYPVDPNWRTE